MAYFDDLRAPLWGRLHLTARGLLAFGGAVFAVLTCTAMVLSMVEAMPLRLSLLGRQNYAHAWVFNAGLATWGGSVFAVAVFMREMRLTCRLGALLLGAGLIALAQWSAAPLDTEGTGSVLEYRLHMLYCIMTLVGFALACAGRGLAVGRRPDIFSLAALYAILCAMGVFVFLPEFYGIAELVLAALCLIWTYARLPGPRA
ncbi:DUF998 domain-containing protein [Tropicimonas sp. S265A]|uniref:DUF998 domain-containing protein n=1 Tax=Tropicimonas sp. S265A TaxID=3415134 RepID=UPI003C7B02E1